MNNLLEGEKAIILWIKEVDYRYNLLSLQDIMKNGKHIIYEKDDIGLIIGRNG